MDVRLVEFLSSAKARSGDRFETLLTRDLEAGGRVVARQGSTVIGQVADVDASGRVKGRAHMALTLTELKVGEESYPIRTDTKTLEAGGTKGRDAKAVTGTTGLGAIIGAIAGGGKGAAIGAAIGGVTGAVTVLATKGKDIELEPEQKFSFRLENDLRIKLNPSDEVEAAANLEAPGTPQQAAALQQRIQTKLNLLEKLMPQYVQRGGDQRKVQPLVEQMQRLMDAGKPLEAEAKLDEVLAILRK